MADPFFEVCNVAMAYQPYRWHHEPGVARLPNGELMAVWGATWRALLPQPVLGAWSVDQGRTWSPPAVLATEAERICGDASLLVHGNTVRLRHTLTELAPKQPGDVRIRYKSAHWMERVSQDNGRTWTTGQRVEPGRAYGSSPHEGLVLRDGTLVWPYWWESKVEAGEQPIERDMVAVALVMRSKDGGTSWEAGGEVRLGRGTGADEPTVVELTNGDLYMLVRTNQGCLYQCRSHDQGTTWTGLEPSPFVSPSAPGVLYRLSWEPSKVLCVWNNTAYGVRFPLDLAISYDDCHTWAHARTISNPGCQVSYPGVTSSADGQIIVVYQQWYETNYRDKTEYSDIKADIKCARFNEEWLKMGGFVSPRVA